MYVAWLQDKCTECPSRSLIELFGLCQRAFPDALAPQVILIYDNKLYLAGQEESLHECSRPCDRYMQVGETSMRPVCVV